MSKELKEVVLNEHNVYRQRIANGEIEGYDPASKMCEMVRNSFLFLNINFSFDFNNIL